jgi:uncharacterized protein (UPF0179 family)
LSEYIKELKIAIINHDLKKIEELSTVAFESGNIDELKEAAAMVAEAIKLLDKERSKIVENMNNIQKMKQYASQINYKDSL